MGFCFSSFWCVGSVCVWYSNVMCVPPHAYSGRLEVCVLFLFFWWCVGT